jgi:hypothetical protein
VASRTARSASSWPRRDARSGRSELDRRMTQALPDLLGVGAP